jgi:3-oxoacyl-[acyl-carrier protein] reductase
LRNSKRARFQLRWRRASEARRIEWARFQQQIQGALKGALGTIQAALPAMREAAMLALTKPASNDLGPR